MCPMVIFIMSAEATLAQLAIKTSGIVGHYWYSTLDANVIRHFVDKTFPSLAKDLIADCASGQGHRWKAGHDLLADVLPRFSSDPGGALHQTGHILLTDFPTKAGIPIPGLSANGIGQQLVEWGIPKGYLSLNIADGALGIMAVSESHADLLSSLNGGTLDAWSFFDTYAEGGIKFYAGLSTQNPLLIASGIEDVAAGLVRTYNTIELAIDEMVTTIDEFFGAALGGSLLGLGVSLLLWRNRPVKERIHKALFTGGRAAILGSAGAISPFLSMGLAAGFCFHELCKTIIDGKAVVREYKPGIYRVTLATCLESSSFREAWEAYSTSLHSIEQLTEKQAASINGQLSDTLKKLNTLIDSSVPELTDFSIPADVHSSKQTDITDMLNQREDDIAQLIGSMTKVD